MAGYTTQYDIGNRALIHCGLSPNIGGTWTGSKNAVVMGFLYDKIRIAALREHIWKFAVIDQGLTKTATVTWQGVSKNVFAYPADYVRMADQDTRLQGTNVQRSSGGAQYSDFQFVQFGILSALPVLSPFWYVQSVTNVLLFDPMFSELFAAQLAMAALPALTQSPQKLSQIEPIYADLLERAIRIDAVEVGNMEPTGTKLKTERLNISLVPTQPRGGQNG